MNRSDLCVDVEMPEEEWSETLVDSIVCPTSKISIHKNKTTGELETISTGKGKIRANIYNKVKELNIDYSQGYFFDKPLKYEDIV